jgi:hypothetical protein
MLKLGAALTKTKTPPLLKRKKRNALPSYHKVQLYPMVMGAVVVVVVREEQQSSKGSR